MHTSHHEEEHDYTYTMPDKKGILDTLKEMKRNASPGPDGFNVEFYLAAWEWIGDDVTKVIRDFYVQGSHVY